MRSSTFSSSHRVPEVPLARTWVAAVVLAVAAAGFMEWQYRAHGLQPRVLDSAILFNRVRRTLEHAGPSSVAVLGSSRALMGIHPDSLSAALGGRPVLQLAINGGTCLPVLEDVAATTSFAGLVVCQVEPTSLFGRAVKPMEAARGFVKSYHDASWVERVEVELSTALQTRVALLQGDRRLRYVLSYLVSHRAWPEPNTTRFTPDRGHAAHFAPTEIAGLERKWTEEFQTLGTVPTEADLVVIREQVQRLASTLHARGGRLVLLMMRGARSVRAAEDARFPEAQFWTPFTATVGVPHLDASSIPGAEGLEPVEGSHLDESGAMAFSRALGQELMRQGW